MFFVRCGANIDTTLADCHNFFHRVIFDKMQRIYRAGYCGVICLPKEVLQDNDPCLLM